MGNSENLGVVEKISNYMFIVNCILTAFNCGQGRAKYCDLSAVGRSKGPLYDLVTWYGINYAGTQIMLWDFQNKGTSEGTGKSSSVLGVPLHYLCPFLTYSVPYDTTLQRAYYLL